MPKIILASASPRRRKLMSEEGYHFEVLASDAEEISEKYMIPSELTVQNAEIKATLVAKSNKESVVIGADTVVSLDNEIFGKPHDLEEAVKMLARLAGRTHIVTTGVSIIQNTKKENFHVNTKVTFKPLSEEEISQYVKLINPLDKAGSYAAQDHGELIIEKHEGSFSNVVGLPMDELKKALADSFQSYPVN
ncbi:MAG: septum formation protein Maf [Rickettsiales bacterium]|nr:septum formation protein Maf [Rickettsiales bacterium]|tara:strand:- start:180 stop:755 length:576 start_codon:yes stop_codon:yes gene_type:complete